MWDPMLANQDSGNPQAVMLAKTCRLICGIYVTPSQDELLPFPRWKESDINNLAPRRWFVSSGTVPHQGLSISFVDDSSGSYISHGEWDPKHSFCLCSHGYPTRHSSRPGWLRAEAGHHPPAMPAIHWLFSASFQVEALWCVFMSNPTISHSVSTLCVQSHGCSSVRKILQMPF